MGRGRHQFGDEAQYRALLNNGGGKLAEVLEIERELTRAITELGSSMERRPTTISGPTC